MNRIEKDIKRHFRILKGQAMYQGSKEFGTVANAVKLTGVTPERREVLK